MQEAGLIIGTSIARYFAQVDCFYFALIQESPVVLCICLSDRADHKSYIVNLFLEDSDSSIVHPKQT